MSTLHTSDKKALFALLADGLYTASQTAWEAHHAAARGEDARAVGLDLLLSCFRAIAAQGGSDATDARKLVNLLEDERTPQLALF